MKNSFLSNLSITDHFGQPSYIYTKKKRTFTSNNNKKNVNFPARDVKTIKKYFFFVFVAVSD